ncbi:MAG: hypothetical protein WCA44_04355 [Acidobacteriaceae bacterium]
MRSLIGLCLLLPVFLCGCNNYSFLSAGQKVYRLNKFTGSVSVVDGDRIAQVRDSSDSGASQQPTAVSHDTLSLDGLDNGQLLLQRKWRDGFMDYIVTVSPVSDKFKAARQSITAIITLELDDQDGFEVALVPLTVSSMTQVVDAKGAPAVLEVKGSQAMSRETYDSIKDTAVQWSGFPGA